MIFYLPIKRGRIKTLMSIICFLFLPTSLLANQFKVIEVCDGDTIKVKGYGVEIRLRLAGIDAPETTKNKIGFGQRYSQEARDYLSGMVLNKTIEIKGHGYRNIDLMLGTVFLNGKNINLEMVRAGLAEVYRGEPPKDLNLDPFFKAERQSRAEKKGIWVQGDNYVSPRTWRKRQRLKSACAIILFGICEKGEK
jgi:endonuclease YncB( thermonuclease family)